MTPKVHSTPGWKTCSPLSSSRLYVRSLLWYYPAMVSFLPSRDIQLCWHVSLLSNPKGRLHIALPFDTFINVPPHKNTLTRYTDKALLCLTHLHTRHSQGPRWLRDAMGSDPPSYTCITLSLGFYWSLRCLKFCQSWSNEGSLDTICLLTRCDGEREWNLLDPGECCWSPGFMPLLPSMQAWWLRCKFWMAPGQQFYCSAMFYVLCELP